MGLRVAARLKEWSGLAVQCSLAECLQASAVTAVGLTLGYFTSDELVTTVTVTIASARRQLGQVQHWQHSN